MRGVSDQSFGSQVGLCLRKFCRAKNGRKTAKNTKKPEKRSRTVWLAYYAATSRILCRRFQQHKWLRVPPFGACRGPPPPPPHFKVLGGGKGRLNLPNVQHATQESADDKDHNMLGSNLGPLVLGNSRRLFVGILAIRVL